MGKRGKKILVAIKKIFSHNSKGKKGEKSNKWIFGKWKHSNLYLSEKLQNTASVASSAVPQPVHPWPKLEEIKLAEVEQEQNKHLYSVAIANFTGNSREVAAIKIQTAFRGYLARRALRALKGLVRLKSLIQGNSVKRQATTTLRCMQTLARIQAQIRSRRIKMLEENQILQRQLLLKHERELESMRMSNEWDDSMQSKEQIEASLLSKQGAVMRRERALAYAFSHQWKSPSRSVNTFMDTNNPQWGWSWLERWMTARPWESRGTAADKDGIFDQTMPNTPQRSTRPPSRQSPATPSSKVPPLTSRIQSSSPRNGWRRSADDTNSIISLRSERPRRHSMAGSSVRDDESLTSSMTLPRYMALTQSAKAKNWGDNKIEIVADKSSVNSVKKRLSFPPSPCGVRRHSAPTRLDASEAVKSGVNGSIVESR